MLGAGQGRHVLWAERNAKAHRVLVVRGDPASFILSLATRDPHQPYRPVCETGLMIDVGRGQECVFCNKKKMAYHLVSLPACREQRSGPGQADFLFKGRWTTFPQFSAE